MLIIYNRIWLGILVLMLVIQPVIASDSVDDKFKLAIGGYKITRYDSSLSLTDRGVGAGVSIIPENTFGWDSKQTVFRADGYYRFNKSHSLTYSWYSIDTSNNKVLSEDIEWIDESGGTITIPTGARVDSGINYDIYKVGYLWSFYSTDKLELMTGAGLHVTRIALNITTDTSSSGIDAESVKTTLPMPVISFALKYDITPRTSWYLKSELFTLSFDDWDGVYSDSQLGMEYRVSDHFGLGVGIGTNTLKIVEETSDYKFSYENRVTGLLVYLAGYF